MADLAMKGVTISCQGYGRVWGTDAFARELDTLKAMGVNAVAIHPYARINADGSLQWHAQADGTMPDYVVRPVKEARSREVRMMVKPHLAYWGSPFTWRGEITFAKESDRKRFFQQYEHWMVDMAKSTQAADILVIGTELKLLEPFEAEWRHLIAEVRKHTKAKLTYAANWDSVHQVAFWDALDFIGVQAYFPLTDTENPSEAELKQAWQRVFQEQVDPLVTRYGKKILFTELGYAKSQQAAKEPWAYRTETSEAAQALQERLMQVALREVKAHQHIDGVFLWKWFVGPTYRENFLLNENHLVDLIDREW
jgi:hypothetical protein